MRVTYILQRRMYLVNVPGNQVHVEEYYENLYLFSGFHLDWSIVICGRIIYLADIDNSTDAIL